MSTNDSEHYFFMNKYGYFFSVEKSISLDFSHLHNSEVERFNTLEELYQRVMKVWDLDHNEVECEIQFKLVDGQIIMIDARGEQEIFTESVTAYIITFVN